MELEVTKLGPGRLVIKKPSVQLIEKNLRNIVSYGVEIASHRRANPSRKLVPAQQTDNLVLLDAALLFEPLSTVQMTEHPLYPVDVTSVDYLRPRAPDGANFIVNPVLRGAWSGGWAKCGGYPKPELFQYTLVEAHRNSSVSPSLEARASRAMLFVWDRASVTSARILATRGGKAEAATSSHMAHTVYYNDALIECVSVSNTVYRMVVHCTSKRAIIMPVFDPRQLTYFSDSFLDPCGLFDLDL